MVREDGLLNADGSANLRATGYLAQERQAWLRRKQPKVFVLFLTPLQVGLSADSSVPDSDGTDHTHTHTYTHTHIHTHTHTYTHTHIHHARERARARERERETSIRKTYIKTSQT